MQTSGNDGQAQPAKQKNLGFFDDTALMNQVEGDRELLREVVELFLVTAPRMMEEVREAVARCDGRSLEAAAHALKGAARNFYVPSVEEAAQALESMGRNRNLDGAETACRLLEAELNKLEKALQALINER